MSKKNVLSHSVYLYAIVLVLIILIVVILVVLSDSINFRITPNPDDYSKLPGGFEPAGSKLRRIIP